MVIVYDLRAPDQWQAAQRHRSYWGTLYTDIHALGYDHVALVFRPSSDPRWRPWEAVRQSRILEDLVEVLQESEAA